LTYTVSSVGSFVTLGRLVCTVIGLNVETGGGVTTDTGVGVGAGVEIGTTIGVGSGVGMGVGAGVDVTAAVAAGAGVEAAVVFFVREAQADSIVTASSKQVSNSSFFFITDTPS
jgi:hypothetical protein